MGAPPFAIVEAIDARDVETCRTLFREYQRALGVDLCFQGFDAEVAGLPGAYAPPDGGLFLALADGAPVGCGALRPHGRDECEMKRLYVRGAARGTGLGRALAAHIIARARARG